MLVGVCKHTFSFLCFSKCVWFSCPMKSSCMMHNVLSPKKKKFVFSKTLHVLLELHWGCWFGIYWTTEHMGSFPTLSLGRAMCELRTVLFLFSYVNTLVFEFSNHFTIIWAFILYFYKHINTAVALRRKENFLNVPSWKDLWEPLLCVYVCIPTCTYIYTYKHTYIPCTRNHSYSL
jgi:hypothetical protein